MEKDNKNPNSQGKPENNVSKQDLSGYQNSGQATEDLRPEPQRDSIPANIFTGK